MILPHRIVPFFEWLSPELWYESPILAFVQVVAGLIILGCFFSYLICVIRHGPFEAFYVVAQVIFTAVPDLLRTSPWRTLAMARLAVKESVRRRVLVVFAIFAVLLLFGAWFLDRQADDPARLYLGVVMTATNYLTIVLAIFLSTFSLPADIKNRTIYTVITKPVRAGEIILGRVLGFTFIGTLMMAAMCAVSYAFVVRGLDHTHQIAAEDARAVLEPGKQEMTLREIEDAPSTSLGGNHRHKILRKGGRLILDWAAGHTHSVQVEGEGDSAKYTVGPARGQLEARVPHYGEFNFMDKKTNRLIKPIHVGYEWEYRMHIEGNTNAAGVWTFHDVSAQPYKEGLPIELTIDVYRSYKGNIEQRVRGSLMLARPGTDYRSAPLLFVSDEFNVQQILFPRRWKLSQDKDFRNYQPEIGDDGKVDIFREFVDKDGNMEVWLECTDPGQFFGVAQGDLYLRSSDSYFWVNFVKAYASMWMQMVLVICFGVMFSSFLSGAVAMLATILTMVIGVFANEIGELAHGVAFAGGPIESLIRVLTHHNPVLPLEGPAAPFIRGLDSIFLWFIELAILVLPRFADFNTSGFVADGYNVYGDLLAQHMTIMLAFCFVLSVMGYFFLRTREIAA